MAKNKHRLNWPLLAVLAAILVLSMAFIHSASYDAASDTYRQYAKKQAIWIIIGLAAFFAIQPLKIRRIRDWSPVIYAAALVLLIMVFIVGETHKGARRWISLGVMEFQPSEIMKLAVILFVAKYLAGREMDGAGFRESAAEGGHWNAWKRVAVPLVIMLVPVLMILKQPDLGTGLVFIPVVLAMMWSSGVKKRYIGALVLAGLLVVPAAWHWVLRDYQKARLVVFLDPENPGRVLKKFVPPERLKKMRKVDSYHLIQSQIAVGSGGMWGKGYGRGTQNTLGYLPERHTDFIFGVVAEEWGFAGATLLMVLFFLLVLIGFDIAMESNDPFGKYVAVGISTLFFTHVAVNTGMTVGLAPITGLTLPFFSYGGSSVVTFFIALGLLAGVPQGNG